MQQIEQSNRNVWAGLRGFRLCSDRKINEGVRYGTSSRFEYTIGTASFRSHRVTCFYRKTRRLLSVEMAGAVPDIERYPPREVDAFLMDFRGD